LIATDVAARGLDINKVSHVINFDLPMEAETYVHRIGRTARAGAEGEAISFCGKEESELLKSIEKLLKKPIPVKDTPELPKVELRPQESNSSGNRSFSNRRFTKKPKNEYDSASKNRRRNRSSHR
jgi:ATP-dependent RNA helicase RhlE